MQSAKLLGFYDHGLAKVKVEYVGRAPIRGSDDQKLMATLRDGDRPVKPRSVVVASATQEYVPEIFDSRPITQMSGRDIPAPQGRPYALGEGSGANTPAERRATVELAASARAPAVQRAPLEPLARPNLASTPPAERLTSPVSAYAPARYDAPAGFISGRGLY